VIDCGKMAKAIVRVKQKKLNSYWRDKTNHKKETKTRQLHQQKFSAATKSTMNTSDSSSPD